MNEGLSGTSKVCLCRCGVSQVSIWQNVPELMAEDNGLGPGESSHF